MSDNKSISHPESSEPKHVNGGRNLVILGLLSIMIAVAATGFSLWIYRQNDIYLDRSRPGFISDGEKNEEEKIDKFSEDGEITKEVLEEYIGEFDYVKGKIDSMSNSFSSNPLSDEVLLFYSPMPDESDAEDAS